MLVILMGITFLVVSGGLYFWYVESERNNMAKGFLLEGATLSNLPSIARLIADPKARAEIQEHVVELGFNPCVSVRQAKNTEFITAELILIDDGGGVHVLAQATDATIFGSSIVRLEAQAHELALLFDVPLQT